MAKEKSQTKDTLSTFTFGLQQKKHIINDRLNDDAAKKYYIKFQFNKFYNKYKVDINRKYRYYSKWKDGSEDLITSQLENGGFIKLKENIQEESSDNGYGHKDVVTKIEYKKDDVILTFTSKRKYVERHSYNKHWIEETTTYYENQITFTINLNGESFDFNIEETNEPIVELINKTVEFISLCDKTWEEKEKMEVAKTAKIKTLDSQVVKTMIEKVMSNIGLEYRLENQASGYWLHIKVYKNKAIRLKMRPSALTSDYLITLGNKLKKFVDTANELNISWLSLEHTSNYERWTKPPTSNTIILDEDNEEPEDDM